MAYSATSEVTLASESELQSIAELRTRLEPELNQLAAEKKDFPHTTGDIFFTRMLRGNSGDLDACVEWYRKFIELRAKFGLDDIHMDCEKNKTPYVMTALPHYDELKKYMNVQVDEKVRTPGGHVIWYDSLGDFRTKEMLADGHRDHYIKFAHYLFERRTYVIDKLSREEGKMIKFVRIMDLEAVGLWMLNKEFKAIDNEYLQPVLVGTSCETIHVLFAINFPWWVLKFFETIKPLLPPRLVARFRFLDSDYLQNQEYLKEVGPALSNQLTSTKTNKDEGSAKPLEGSSEIIAAGKVMERVVEVSPGQKVSWSYRVAKPDEVAEKRSLLGKLATAATSAFAGTEIVFSVYGLWTDTVEAEMEKVPAKIRSAGLEAGDAAEFEIDGKAVDFTVGAGVNVVAANPKTKAILFSNVYDANADAEGASKKLIDDLKGLPTATMVLVAVKGTGLERMTDDAIAALKTVGSTITSGHWHEGYALIGRKGGAAISEKRGPDVTAEGSCPIMESEADLVEGAEVHAEAGVQSGSVTVERGGMVMVRWSNYHSFVAKKMVTDYKVTVE